MSEYAPYAATIAADFLNYAANRNDPYAEKHALQLLLIPYIPTEIEPRNPYIGFDQSASLPGSRQPMAPQSSIIERHIAILTTAHAIQEEQITSIHLVPGHGTEQPTGNMARRHFYTSLGIGLASTYGQSSSQTLHWYRLNEALDRTTQLARASTENAKKGRQAHTALTNFSRYLLHQYRK